MQILSADIETKILNGMDESLRGITHIGVQRPELLKVISNIPTNYCTQDV